MELLSAIFLDNCACLKAAVLYTSRKAITKVTCEQVQSSPECQHVADVVNFVIHFLGYAMTANIFKFSDLAGQNFNPTCNFQRHPRIASHQSSSKVHSKKRSRSRCVTLNQQKLCKAVLILSEYSSYPERKRGDMVKMLLMQTTFGADQYCGTG
ncbi:hypothetical protein OUZ56_005242 [Daphnia magna]|uniref:Uncharacterized protein n=1 Tax=Daphnia magna TaxID=35525 RepID=A0ABQ9YS92_9CRUS|nr:hypothetical protein OUZ56_005242 [Daphnia magna]